MKRAVGQSFGTGWTVAYYCESPRNSLLRWSSSITSFIEATSGCHPERSARNARVAKDLLSECAKRRLARRCYEKLGDDLANELPVFLS